MAKEDVLVTTQEPHWQTEWDTEYIQDEEKEKFCLKHAMGNWLDSLHMRFVLNML